MIEGNGREAFHREIEVSCMALSNWDSCAFNEKGEPTDGVFKSPRTGVEIAIYKNWLYIRDKKAWEEGGSYVEHTVGQITHGFGQYKDVTYMAVRGPKNGVYFAVWSTVYPKRKFPNTKKGNKAWHKEVRFYAMVGIGCSGYGSKGKYLGIKERELAFLRNFLRSKDEEHLTFLPKELVELDLSGAKRFNQGDGIFEEHLYKTRHGTLTATKPGKAQTPLFVQALRGRKRRGKK
jgi:hypothetical protein